MPDLDNLIHADTLELLAMTEEALNEIYGERED
jgi:hypothetical protein